jgi:hypothetical protein
MVFHEVLRDHRGSIYTDSLVSFLLGTMFLSISISATAAMFTKYTLTTAATDVKRLIETDGKYDTAERQKIANFLSSENVTAVVTVSPAKDEYDLGETFSVTLSKTASLGGGGTARLSLPLNGKAAGSCEVYHK